MIDIKFNDNIKHNYSSFKEILKLDNYDDIIYINCYNSLYNLPSLPNSLQILYCAYNNLFSLPKLPNSLIHLNCSANNLSSLPELPNSLINLYCSHNKLPSLPKLPNSLETLDCCTNEMCVLPELPNSLMDLWCHHNNLSSLPELPNSLKSLYYNNNPIYIHIQKYFDGDTNIYNEYQNKIKIIFSNKIGNWYLDCKYNPKYLYCRKRLMKEYEELYG